MASRRFVVATSWFALLGSASRTAAGGDSTALMRPVADSIASAPDTMEGGGSQSPSSSAEAL
jgi:hypothetical protein